MFKNILIPTDGSEFSEKVVQDGVRLAKSLSAKVTGVHVYPSYTISPYGEFGPRDDVARQQSIEFSKTEANRFLDRMEQAAKAAGVPFGRVVVENDHPHAGIIQAATGNGCDLIVMAAHGRRGLSGLLIGSETNKVLTHSKIPVLVYR